jgi:hypothetical protein
MFACALPGAADDFFAAGFAAAVFFSAGGALRSGAFLSASLGAPREAAASLPSSSTLRKGGMCGM